MLRLYIRWFQCSKHTYSIRFHLFSLHPFKTRLQRSSWQGFPTKLSDYEKNMCKITRYLKIFRVEMVPRCATNCRWSCGQRTVSSTLRPPRLELWCIDHLPGGLKRGETFISRTISDSCINLPYKYDVLTVFARTQFRLKEDEGSHTPSGV